MSSEAKTAANQALESRHFRKADSQRELLKHLALLHDQGSTPTPASIAEALFNGNSGSVAVTIARLRQRLEAYYSEEGAGDTVRLRIPERAYHLVTEAPPLTASRLPKARPSGEIDHPRYRELIEALTQLDGHDLSNLNKLTKTWVASSARYSARFDREHALPQDKEFKTFLDVVTGSNPEDQLTLADMRSYSKTLGVHPVLIDPVSSKESSKECLLLELAGTSDETIQLPSSACEPGEFVAAGDSGTSDLEYGAKAHYHVPNYRLPGPNLAFVDLILEPEGSSDSHRHYGNELAFLAKGGPVEIRLHDGGEVFRLEQNDFVHFYAEQLHSAHNISKSDAELIIVRSHQHHSEPRTDAEYEPLSREDIQEQVRKFIGHGQPVSNRFTQGWILETAGRFPRSLEPTRFGKKRKDVPDQVLNRVGLARYLARIQKSGELNSEINRLIFSTKPYPLEDLRKLADKFTDTPEAQYTPLLYEFVFPGVPHHVFVARDGEAHTTGWIDLEDMFPGSVSDGVKHEIPKRSLASSDVAIAWLTLDSEKVTEPASHCGSELLIPIEGEATIQFERGESGSGWETVCTVKAPNQICYFNSALRHRVCNFGAGQVPLFLVRFYDEPVKVRDGAGTGGNS